MSKQHTNRATRRLLVALMTLPFALTGVLMQPTAFAQQSGARQIPAPPVIKGADDNRKLRARPERLTAPEKLKRLKRLPDVTASTRSKSAWKPVLRFTPRNSFSAPTNCWYFYQPAFFTPQFWDDDGVALFVNPATTAQMVMRFVGLQNQAYAIDITLGIPGTAGNVFAIGVVVDGVPAPQKSIRVGAGPYEHLLFELPPSQSGQYMVVVFCSQMATWWTFASLEVGLLQ